MDKHKEIIDLIKSTPAIEPPDDLTNITRREHEHRLSDLVHRANRRRPV